MNVCEVANAAPAGTAGRAWWCRGRVAAQADRRATARNKARQSRNKQILPCLECANQQVRAASENSAPSGEAETVVRGSADDFAGLWVAHHAASKFPPDHNLPKDAVSALSGATWPQLDADWTARRAASVSAVDGSLVQRWEEMLDVAWHPLLDTVTIAVSQDH